MPHLFAWSRHSVGALAAGDGSEVGSRVTGG